MQGGTWTTQNKVRPGVYINFNSAPQPTGTVGERGIVTMPAELAWGAPHEVLTIEAGAATLERLGYALGEPQLLLVREALKRARTLLLYRVNSGTPAAATSDDLTVTAAYGGSRGNDLAVAVTETEGESGTFTVTTYLSGKEIDTQQAATVGELTDNGWVAFSGTGALQAIAALPLTGGANGAATAQDYADYLSAIELHDFHAMAVPSTDDTLKQTIADFVRRLREQEGRKVQAVLANYPIADYEGVISVRNGVRLADETVLDAAQATAWTAGAAAGAQMNESLTYAAYDGAIDVEPRLTHTDTVAALQGGEWVFTHNAGRAIVEQDINSLTSFTPETGKAFAKNRVIRVLDGINNDFVRIFGANYIGKAPNNEDGRNLLKSECISYLSSLQGIGAIQNFDAQADIAVLAGADVDSVVIESYVQPVDSIEKIYIQVEVR
ncbi:phage tail sheath family protein [Paenibacillus sp. IB182496]|uniref:Phage tail sheath family protein n=1 Tax=Paenibacillus sabuli TaxID=2772509 RepID=A0A927BSX6_9BACL|nr:phage tail sheath family protein [Paenibacillus sabuli]MBD2846192.1 phage tail sheath family protein [Paenibacillus sabuli]